MPPNTKGEKGTLASNGIGHPSNAGPNDPNKFPSIIPALHFDSPGESPLPTLRIPHVGQTPRNGSTLMRYDLIPNPNANENNYISF